ncbi:MAG TPA: UrcA family protein [Caulobacteraceae bacterium]|nr:UrcA family protein [Caulobacteraceae bacterium]
MTITRYPARLALAGASALSLAAGAVSTPAHAQPGYDTAAGPSEITVQAPGVYSRINPFTGEGSLSESRAVYYGDLDLRTDWGARALHARVVRAAVQVCRDLDYRGGASLVWEDMDDCVRPAVQGAMAQAPMPGSLRYRYDYVGYLY